MKTSYWIALAVIVGVVAYVYYTKKKAGASVTTKNVSPQAVAAVASEPGYARGY